MRRICLPWDSKDSMGRRPRQQPMVGPAPAALREIKESSAPNAGNRNQQQTVSGPAPAAPGIKGDSVPSAENRNQQEFLSISVINVDGSRRIRRIRRSSVRSVATPLMVEILRNRGSMGSVFLWRHVIIISENAVKIAGVVIAYSRTDVGDGKAGTLQKKCCLVQALDL